MSRYDRFQNDAHRVVQSARKTGVSNPATNGAEVRTGHIIADAGISDLIKNAKKPCPIEAH